VSHLTSKDGTAIAYDRQGSGPAVILVGGGLDDGAENAPLVPLLAGSYTVYNYARRGRGGSGDTQPYAVAREIEDIEALVAEAGGSAYLYGVSSGGALALEAAAAGVAVGKLAVYEVPYGAADEARARAYVEQTEALLAEGRRDEAIKLFMRFAGSSEEDIAGADAYPMWPGLVAIAHTLAYEAACTNNYQPPPARLSGITQPTLVATGDTVNPYMAGLPPELFDRAAAAIVARIPHAERVTLAGQSHVADPAVVAPMLERFFRA
jgi:pimeloyl-ACP methyl ester carboxylesterase